MAPPCANRRWNCATPVGGGGGSDLDHDRQEGEMHPLQHRVTLDLVAQSQECLHVQLVTQVEVGDGACSHHALHHGTLVAPQGHNGGARMKLRLLCCLLSQQQHASASKAVVDMRIVRQHCGRDLMSHWEGGRTGGFKAACT